MLFIVFSILFFELILAKHLIIWSRITKRLNILLWIKFSLNRDMRTCIKMRQTKSSRDMTRDVTDSMNTNTDVTITLVQMHESQELRSGSGVASVQSAIACASANMCLTFHFHRLMFRSSKDKLKRHDEQDQLWSAQTNWTRGVSSGRPGGRCLGAKVRNLRLNL